MTPLDPSERGRRLADWFRVHARILPWRTDASPYRVLLSEFMLQQTRVDTVLPYFERFVARWPDLASLARASEEEVLTAWAGLGYYRRARALLAAARAADAMGGLPETPEALLALPGVGPYTAGAIAGLAFGRRCPAVDGNVERVVSRVTGLDLVPGSTRGRRAVLATASAWVTHSPAEAGVHTAAMMELGALVCTPRAPNCPACPMSGACVAEATGHPTAWPKTAPRRAPVAIAGAAVLVRDGAGRWLVGRRGEGLLAGTWEPVRADDPATLVRLVDELLPTRNWREAGEVRHVFTHRALRCRVWIADGEGSPAPAPPYTEFRWVTDLDEVAASRLARRIVTTATSGGG